MDLNIYEHENNQTNFALSVAKLEVHQLSHHSTTDVCIQFRIFFVRTTYAMVSKERLKCLLCEDDEQEGRALGHQKAGDP